jgi:hypothetical protein
MKDLSITTHPAYTLPPEPRGLGSGAAAIELLARRLLAYNKYNSRLVAFSSKLAAALRQFSGYCGPAAAPSFLLQRIANSELR